MDSNIAVEQIISWYFLLYNIKQLRIEWYNEEFAQTI